MAAASITAVAGSAVLEKLQSERIKRLMTSSPSSSGFFGLDGGFAQKLDGCGHLTQLLRLPHPAHTM